MDKKDIFIFAIAITFLAFKLYQKYIKKANNDSSGDKKVSKDEDYEPYSKK
jgi:hypothetical protein